MTKILLPFAFFSSYFFNLFSIIIFLYSSLSFAFYPKTPNFFMGKIRAHSQHKQEKNAQKMRARLNSTLSTNNALDFSQQIASHFKIPSPVLVNFDQIQEILNLLRHNKISANTMWPYWYIFADAITTAHLIKKFSEEKNFIIVEQLVNNLKKLKETINSKQAKIIYKIIEPHINYSLKQEFIKKWQKNNTPIQNYSKYNKIKHIYFNDLLTKDPEIIANQIFSSDLSCLEKVSTEEIIASAYREETSDNLNIFLQRKYLLKNLIMISLVKTKKFQKLFYFWQKVGEFLLIKGDFFATHALSQALTSPPIKFLAHKYNIPKKNQNKLFFAEKYHDIKQQFSQPKFISELFLELDILKQDFNKLPNNSEKYLEIIIIASSFTIEHDKVLYYLDTKKHYPTDSSWSLIFYNLKNYFYHKDSENFLIGYLNPGKFSHTNSRSWTGADLASWLKHEKISDHALKLAHIGIIDGPTLLEAFAHFQANPNKFSKTLTKILSRFCSWSKKHKIIPFMNQNSPNMRSVNLSQNYHDEFSWISWLTTNNLGRKIAVLFEHNINNFYDLLICWHMNSDKFLHIFPHNTHEHQIISHLIQYHENNFTNNIEKISWISNINNFLKSKTGSTRKTLIIGQARNLNSPKDNS